MKTAGIQCDRHVPLFCFDMLLPPKSFLLCAKLTNHLFSVFIAHQHFIGFLDTPTEFHLHKSFYAVSPDAFLSVEAFGKGSGCARLSTTLLAVKPHPLHSAFLYSQTKNSVGLVQVCYVHFIRVISHIFRNQSVKCEI